MDRVARHGVDELRELVRELRREVDALQHVLRPDGVFLHTLLNSQLQGRDAISSRLGDIEARLRDLESRLARVETPRP